MIERAWKYGGMWNLLTERTPRQMGREAVATYYPPKGVSYFQYRGKTKPEGSDYEIVQVNAPLTSRNYGL